MIPILYALFGFLAFLFPVAVYLLVLAVLNSRRRPTMISGPWDFVGVLFALSGFLLVGGPWVLSGLNARWRATMVQGRLGSLTGETSDWWGFWIALWGLYFVLVLGGAAFILWRRRQVTVIYNIERPLLEEALSLTLDRLALEGAVVGNRVYIGARSGPGEAAAEPRVETFQAAGNGLSGGSHPVGNPGAPAQYLELGRTAVLELDPFPATHHMTLRWRFPEGDDPALRRDIETELARVLAEAESGPNPTVGWFLTAASCLFFLMLVGLALLILLESKR